MAQAQTEPAPAMTWGREAMGQAASTQGMIKADRAVWAAGWHWQA